MYSVCSCERHSDIAYMSVETRQGGCYCLSMRPNCFSRVGGVGAPRTGFVSPTMRASCTSLVSVKALEPFPLISPLVTGLLSHVSGWQSYLGLGLSRSLIVYVWLLFCIAHSSQSLHFGSAGDRQYCLALPRRLSLYCAD